MATTCLGVDLGGTNVRVGLISGGSLKELKSCEINGLSGGDEVLDQILELAESFSGYNPEAIGFGVPSVVDTRRGIVYDVQNIPGWDKVPLKQRAEERLKIPAFVNNDANCFAIGEYYFGKGRPYESLIALNIGTGFAGGVVINGQLYEGRNCGAGEFGTIPYRESMLEHYCAGLFFQREHNTTGKELAKRAAAGDPEALEIFSEFGRHLGYAMKVVLYSYDPEAVILGGSVSHSFPYFRESMEEEMSDFAYSNTLKNLSLELSEEPDIAVLGAAALCRQGSAGKR
ncbi:MAG: ROK family protein [Balneolaceae bacterium]